MNREASVGWLRKVLWSRRERGLWTMTRDGRLVWMAHPPARIEREDAEGHGEREQCTPEEVCGCLNPA